MEKKNRNEAVNWYLANFSAFEKKLNGNSETPIHRERKRAISKFSELGFPTTKDEEWKYTNVAPLLAHKLKSSEALSEVSPGLIERLTFPASRSNTLVLVNGRFSQEMSTLSLNYPGVIVSNLATAIHEYPDLVAEHLGKYAKYDSETFTAMNTGFLHDGLFVYVPANVEVNEMIHVIHICGAELNAFASYPRSLVVIEKNSGINLTETYYGAETDVYFNNVVGEFVVKENAKFNHIKIQEEGSKAFHISNYQFHQERDSNVWTVNIDLGGALVRNNLNVRLNDRNCETHLFGFFTGKGSQHIDNHTFIDHAMPHCFSNELYKGILDDRAKGVFNGKILVRQDAQKTNALQSNKTLLLTDDAVINAKPQLEIFADDVKCTHGATIGQLDDEALFYLRTRGISEIMAGAMLRHAFVADVLENVKDEDIRAYLDKKVIERFTA